MNYKYRKGQIFGKRLDVPKIILNKVYTSLLSFNEFIEYKLYDKIPISCIIEFDRKIVEKFGIEKCKKLDWELINNQEILLDIGVNIRNVLMNVDAQTEDINFALYELVKYQIIPTYYSSKMKEIYSDNFFEISQDDNTDLINKKTKFNNAKTPLVELVSNWNLYKDKDLSYCLLNDTSNKNNITNNDLKEFMDDYGVFVPLIINNNDIYTIIKQAVTLSTEEEKKEYIKQFTDGILNNIYRNYKQHRSVIELTNDQYKEIFKYSSMEEYLKLFTYGILSKIIDELKTLPQDYVFNMPMPFSSLLNYGVLDFVNTFGLKNTVDFDNECGHFFTTNNCEMLKSMYDMYLHYGSNEQDPNKNIYMVDNGHHLDGNCTKDQFYEAMRRMMFNGPTDGSFISKTINYGNITGEFRARNLGLFISEQAPKELQDAFYSRTINSELILSNPTYREYFKNVELEFLFKYMPIMDTSENNENNQINFVNVIKQKFGNEEALDVMLSYGKYIESVFELNELQNFEFNSKFSKDDFLNELDKVILQAILEGNLKYDENIVSHFKNNNPTLFLDQSVPQDIRNKFYNKELTLNDFSANLDLIELFGNTNITLGFPKELSWMIPVLSDSNDMKSANYKRLKIISAYLELQDSKLASAFEKYVVYNVNNIKIDKIDYISKVLKKLSLSNSSEIFAFRNELANQILNSTNPLESLDKIEDVFIKNNIPSVGKIYSCFEILHPDFDGFDFDVYSTVSPILKKSSTTSKKIIVFSDLIRASFGSNNRSVNAYLKNIEVGSNLYNSIKNGQIQQNSLNEIEQNELITFSRHLATLYNNTMKSKKENEAFISTGDALIDILELSKKLSPDGSTDYNLADRVIKMFCGFSGIDTLEEAKAYISQKIKTANTRNRSASNSEMKLETGDFVKGIGDIRYLKNILQNGSVSKEFLGSSAGSDATPLDTDISIINSSNGSIRERIDSTAASLYGPIWFVLKNDERFITTRNSSQTIDTKRDLSKMEVFYTGVCGDGHYGIRTGFASSEINYIVMENYDPKVGLEIAMNGFYIPVANMDGKIIFTPKDYDNLRKKMSGLSYFGEQNYVFSEDLVNEDVQYFASQIEESNHDVQVKKMKINKIIKQSLDEVGLELKNIMDNDLTEGFVELIDTGSTGRGTNKPGDGDFDFMMRLDKSILANPDKLQALKNIMLKNLGKGNSLELTGSGDFRLKNVQIDDETNVDIDITFTEKTDRISYSTDMALQDRLTTIKRIDPKNYEYVLANILLAKRVLKEAEVYKPNRGAVPQGGLGGVGIENWILQNGGSFVEAAKSFVKAAEGKTFAEFQKDYQIWDFGDNHLAESRGQYPHDNFVSCNMSSFGYEKMVQVLNEYIKKYDYNEVCTMKV